MISPNYTSGGLSFDPNDPHAVSGAQWYLDAPSGIDLDLPDAWEITKGSSSVVVAVMDSGIVTTHPEFSGRLWENPAELAGSPGVDDDNNGYFDDVNGWDTTSFDGDPNIGDDDGGSLGTGVGHGTFVSSILLANTDNSHQIAGFDHDARLLTVRSFNQATGINLGHVLGGLDYLLVNVGYWDVVNMSWIAPASATLLGAVLDSLEDEEALLVAGAGNYSASTEDWIPASHPLAVTVSATDDTDSLAVLTNTGPSVDFSAPGVDIYTAAFDDPSSTNAFHSESGTSFSTPMITGIASLGLSLRPGMTRDELV
ncbi:MAG: S8 family serine peptidase, partial [Thermoanaerobaculia bacterium]|nr:S8 family serine peptidase [Thermoanaerobaculia bacterium]